MQKCIDYLHRKSFNTYGVVLLTLFGFFAVVVISISGSLALDTSFHCYDKTISKTKDASLIKNINIKCSLAYQEKFLFTLPMYAMFILNFGIVFALSIIYSYLVKHRVEKFYYPTKNDGDENDEMLPSRNLGQNPRGSRECRFPTFSIYVVHLLVARIIPLLVFAIWIFYQAHFPTNFPCPLGPEMQGKGTSNLTFIDCINPIGGKSKTLVYIVATVDVCLVTLSFLELGYIAWLAFNDRDFMTDEEFCTVYLLRTRNRSRKSVNQVRDGINPDDADVFQVEDDFGGPEISMRPLEDIFVNVVIQEGREHTNAYPREFKRHEIYQCHLKTSRTVTKLTSTADIFKPTKDGEAYPRTILVIGRPGIGKSMLTKKLLHQWKRQEDEFWRGKIVILLQFRAFYEKNNVTLREMLSYGEGLSPHDFNAVYEQTLLNPTKIVLIFDGFDELSVDDELLGAKIKAINDLDEKMPVFTIFKKLLCGKLLSGVTVLTTSRPTAQRVFQKLKFNRTVEILGFFEEEIKEYVFKFCKNNTTGELIWNEIQGSPEMRSLCYIPVNSYIVCLTLKESVESDVESESQLPEGLNSNILGTITELYKRAVKVLLYRHHPEYKLKPRPNDYLISPFPKELANELVKLKEVAESGISQHKLIFEKPTDDEFRTLANSGFFYQLPDKRRNLFCFLHLTLQEFLAASKVVDDMDKVAQFLDDHVKDPKWHLVIQFVAGLVGDKIREDPKEYKSQKVFADIQKRLEEWAFLLGTTNEIALLGIKCLYELQDIDIMKSVSSKFLAEGDGKLALWHLDIAAIDSTALFMFLCNSKNLKQLVFSYCTIQDNCSYHLKLLLNTAGNTITFFNWSLGDLGDVAVKYLSEALKSENCKLVALCLDRNNIKDQDVRYLSEALKSENCKLTELYLGRNKITDQAVQYLSEALKSENCNLTELQLVRNDITHQGVKYLSETLQSENCELTALVLERNEITDQAVKYLSEALKSENCKLTELNLGDNEITDQAVKYLSEALKSENCKLVVLCLHCNNIKYEGARYLSEALKSENCKFTKLSLYGNKITDQGLGYLSEALKRDNCKLTELQLRRNEITDRGVEYLSEALNSENCELAELDLSYNEIKDQGVEYLSEALKSKNCRLIKLQLRGNKITDQGVEYLREALKSENCELTELDLSGNGIRDQAVDYMSEACKVKFAYLPN
ncbi:NACHT, LRR and PYD domains-containing 14-like [Paramuricea clavata]|uniref:NACHT, LRR and PYD domains-containing 14-like n=1 Tax=Paramuricea clavata TaxID=317549 RepID=A0A7D9HXI6_PARCT|nr:NACHT, LRR and PYD domains-containing 14-like [Paramuricea clavata]